MEEAHFGQGSKHPNANTYILKTYYTNGAEDYYNNEVAAFRRLKPAGNACIVRFYGNFIQHGTYNILLEYANYGTLERYFQFTTPPSRGEDITRFWAALYNILGALTTIHCAAPGNSIGPQIFQG